MNKHQWGFKGDKALTRLMGNIKGKRLIKAFGRKRALNSKQASTHLSLLPPPPTPPPWTTPRTRALWFRRSLQAGLSSQPSPSPPTCSPTVYLSNSQYRTWLPAGCPAPCIIMPLLALAPSSGAPPPSHPAQFFCSDSIWRLPCGGKFLLQCHHIPYLGTWKPHSSLLQAEQLSAAICKVPSH